MSNPWSLLPTRRPFILPQDAEAVSAFNRTARPAYRFEIEILPEPFFGSPEAPVVSLGLNPGLNTRDYAVHEDPAFIENSRQSLVHRLAPYPFLHLQPNDDSRPGSVWWRTICKELISDVGIELLGQRLLHLQYFPYHSFQFGGRPPRVASQDYTFRLLRASLAGGAEVILMRSADLWFRAVPELGDYSKLHIVRNFRRPFLSRGNLPSYYIVRDGLLGST